MSENKELLRLASDLTPFDLPIGVYVVTKDGRFVNCNRRAREILRLPLEGAVDDTMARFYRDPRQREAISREVESLEARGLHLEKLITLDVGGGREIFVRDFTRSLGSAGEGVLGFVSCVVDVTEGERSNRLLDALPAGVYRLDENDNYEQANRAFARILGYASPDEIAGRPSGEFYVNPEEARKLRRMIIAQHPEPVTNFIAELRKQDGRETIFVNINAHMVEGDDGGYAGREGTIIDVTREERYRRILRDVPVGLNVIRREGGKDVIVDCNEQFLKLFEFPAPSHATGFDARRLHASPEEYERFTKALEVAARQGRPLIGHHLKVITLNGDHLTVEVSSQPLLDSEGNVVGRTGAVRDITQEAELRERLDELTYDFGNVLHNYTTTLLMVQLSVEPVIRSLAPDPFNLAREVSPEQAGAAVAAPAAGLAAALEQLLELVKDDAWRAAALPAAQWQELGDLIGTLRGYEERIPMADFRPVVLGEVALRVVEVCARLGQSHKFARELVRDVRDAAQGLLRITNLISLHQMRDAVLEMDHQVRSLREFVTSNAREPEDRTVCRVAELIGQARRNLDDYAHSRRMSFKVECEEVNVRAVRREVVRALTNLLHNAIKYSWSRDKSKPLWVTIRAAVGPDSQVHIEFKNWGVPIPQEEIDQELLFKIGYRGRLSGDRGRVGTGIGLADARRVAHAHRGDVVVTSRPAVSSRADDDYDNPFITTVTMKLPVYRAQGAGHEN
jgi:PAS domain S-box-containing protein